MKGLKKKRRKDCMAGFLGTKAKVGLIAKPESLVADKKARKERVIRRAGQRWPCAILGKGTKKDQKEFLGKRERKSSQ